MRKERVPEQFIAQVADVIRRYYDGAYLARHPMTSQLIGLLGEDSALAVPSLRRMLLGAVEELRPHSDTPADSAAWRPYRVLYDRYILGKDLDALAAELGLSRRQVQREQRRGFATVAVELWARKVACGDGEPGPQGGSTLSQEISRVAAEAQTFDALEQLQSALEPIRPFAQRNRVDVLLPRTAAPMRAIGNPALLRQFFVSALSFLVRLAAADHLLVRIDHLQGAIVFSLVATPGLSTAGPPREVALPEALLALAQANDLGTSQEAVDGAWRLRIDLPPAPENHTVVIVEDNTDLVKLFSRYLARRGYRLVPVSDSTTAVARIAEILPDAVVLDLMMSQVDGWQILQQLQDDARLRRIPVVVCSVLDEPELATSLGARAYLRKPVRPAQLLESLARLLRSSHSAEPGSAAAH